MNLGLIARANLMELRFFVIRFYPNVPLNKRDYLGARTDQLPRTHFALADNSVFRSNDSRIAQIGLRQRERRFLCAQVGAEEEFLRVQHSALTFLCFKFSPGAVELGVCSGQIRLPTR